MMLSIITVGVGRGQEPRQPQALEGGPGLLWCRHGVQVRGSGMHMLCDRVL